MTDMTDLPENWKEMSHQEQKIWLIRYYGRFPSAGEWDGIYEFAPEPVQEAYREWLQEEPSGD